MFNMIFMKEGCSPVDIAYDGENLKTSSAVYRVLLEHIKDSFSGIDKFGILVFKLPSRVAMVGMKPLTEGLTFCEIEGKGKLYHERGRYYFISYDFLDMLYTSNGARVDCGYKYLTTKEIENDKTGKVQLHSDGVSIPTFILVHAMGHQLLITSIESLDINGVLLSDLEDSNSYLLTDSKSKMYKVNMFNTVGSPIQAEAKEKVIEYYSAIMNIDDDMRKNLRLFLDNYYEEVVDSLLTHI
ncbi:hypothetical protein [Lysinibacillus xylanilyticus]|uniref:hypothetical protein n=1 Tax=Lysinibacillus xylanilyticus TaxID=582475 RepID=UPI0036DD290B